MFDDEELARLEALVRRGDLSQEVLDRLRRAGSSAQPTTAEPLPTTAEPLPTTAEADDGPITLRTDPPPTTVDPNPSQPTRAYVEGDAPKGPEPGGSPARYALGELLGRGGGGSVRMCHDQVLDREVAIKMMFTQDAVVGEHRRRFFYEARATARLAHPGVIPIHDAGVLEDGRPYYVMPRVDGRSLHEVLESLRRRDASAEQRYPLPRLLAIFGRICQTVAYAHDQGIIHRDLKPANILLGRYGEVFVADWGLAKPHHQASGPVSDRPETRAGVTVGTLEYMSPEQVRGDADIGPRADVYSLGVMLFEMLTLELPFLAPSPVALMLRILRERVPDPRSASHRTIPDPLAELCMRATEPDPEARVASAAALGDAVTTFIDGVEEKRRRARMADELLETARVRMAEFEAEQAEISEARSVVGASLAGLASDAPFEARRLLWSAGQTLDARALEAEARFAEATRAASQALEYADLDDAHALLADQYWRRYVEASRTGQRAAAVFFADHVRAHDRGRYAARLASTGTLEITTEPPDATVTVQRQAPLGPLLEGRFADPPEVEVGSYIVLVESPGHAPVRRPVKVEPGRPTVVHVDAPVAFEGHEAYAYIPALVAAVGGDPDAHRGLPRAVVEVGPFFIGRFPVTVREYVDFLEAIRSAQGVEAARAHAPRGPDGTVYLDVQPESGRFEAPATDRDGDVWKPDWPIMMVSRQDAEAYCAWASERDGARIRLPTAQEWEVAARGVDERIYPWGNGFDATLTKVVDSPGPRGAESVGSRPRDRSPFDVYDMAGLVSEWTSTPDGEHPDGGVLKGAGYRSQSIWCRSASRVIQRVSFTGVQFGFRVVREPG